MSRIGCARTWRLAGHVPAPRICLVSPFLNRQLQSTHWSLTRTSSFAVSSFSIFDMTSWRTNSTCS